MKILGSIFDWLRLVHLVRAKRLGGTLGATRKVGKFLMTSLDLHPPHKKAGQFCTSWAVTWIGNGVWLEALV
jgi:hypothetical protein